MKKVSLFHFISTAVLLILLLMALLISSGKTRLVFAVLSLTAFAALFLEERRRKQTVGVFLVLFLVLSVFYNMQNLDRINPMTEVKTQTIYQEDDYVNQYYPDNFLRLLLKEHEVKIPYEIKNIEEYITPERRERGFNAKYYKETNYGRFLRAYAKECVVSKSLPDMKGTDEILNRLSGLSRIGKSSDMLRYTFLLNEDGEQESAYFWYSWYYYSFMTEERAEGNFDLYVQTAGINAEDSFVALWDSMQNLYLMTESYYESEVIGHG